LRAARPVPALIAARRVCCITRQPHHETDASPTAHLRLCLARQRISFLILHRNVACGSVRNSRCLRLRPLQPILSGLLLGFQSHASYLCQQVAVALDQPFGSMTNHSALPMRNRRIERLRHARVVCNELRRIAWMDGSRHTSPAPEAGNSLTQGERRGHGGDDPELQRPNSRLSTVA
jgi:hypothetical protein